MDPSQVQADNENDVHSLENADETGAAQQNVTDATGGKPAGAPPSAKRSPIKKLWDKFNIYLLLFILVIIIAIGIVVISMVKSSKSVPKNVATQNLTQDALKQLASTDVTVGNAKQILTVQSNAVFAGAVLIRSNLEVAGTLKLGGGLSVSTLNVSGATQLSDATVNNLTVNNSLNLSGALTVKNGLNVTGLSTLSNVAATQISTGSLQLNGDLNLTHHITAGGTIPGITKGAAVGSGGTASLSGSDTSGSITTNTGAAAPAGCLATVTFSKAFANTPHVVVSPVGAGAAGLQYYVTRSTGSFVLCTASAPTAGVSFGFDYIVLD
jgi:hypothetical protein